jgi:chorismate-pyruvate lyase
MKAASTENPRRAGFDPARVFVAQSARPPALGPIDVAALSPLQRGLLVIDGTVTTFLEATLLEPVEVVRLDQQESRAITADEWLGIGADAPVIRRRVMLRGRDSQRLLAWADSRIATERAGGTLRAGLEQAAGGLGRILLDSALETRRECLWFGREGRAEAPAAVAAAWPGEFLSRTYRVIAGGRPLMVITERFPL